MTSGAERSLYWATALTIILVDLATKLVAEATLLRTTGNRIIGEYVQLRLVYNPGAAFGLHVGPYSRWIFLIIAVIAVIVLNRMSRTAPPGDWFRQLALGLVTGGAAGNLVDRIRSPLGVVDFLDVGLGTMRWPTFNVADIAVSLGAFALAVSLWREDTGTSRTESPSVT